MLDTVHSISFMMHNYFVYLYIRGCKPLTPPSDPHPNLPCSFPDPSARVGCTLSAHLIIVALLLIHTYASTYLNPVPLAPIVDDREETMKTVLYFLEYSFVAFCQADLVLPYSMLEPVVGRLVQTQVICQLTINNICPVLMD